MRSVGAGDYLGGLAVLGALLGLCAWCGWALVTRRCGHLRGAPRVLAIFVVASAALVVALLAPAICGVLSRAAAVGSAAALAFVGLLLRRVPARLEAQPRGPSGGRRSALVAAAGVAIAAGGAVGFLLHRATTPVVAVDALTIHLPQVASMIRTGSIWDLVQYTPDWSYATYPQNGTLMLLGAVLPWDSASAARFVAVPFLAALAVAAYCAARELGAASTTATLTASFAVTLPVVALPGLDQAQVDTAMLAWFAIGALFLLRAARSGNGGDLMVAGVGLGLAFGTKWYAVPYVVILVAIYGAAVMPRVRSVAVLSGWIALLGGFWLLRNWILTGNPVYPARVAPLGVELLDAPPNRRIDSANFTVSDYLFDREVWREWLGPAYARQFGAGGAVVGLLVLAAAVVAARARDRRAGAVLAACVAFAAVYTVLPYSAFGAPGQPMLVGPNARWLVPAVLAGAVLAAWLSGARPRWRGAIDALLLIGIADGARRSFGREASLDATVALAVAAGLALLAVGWLVWRTRPRHSRAWAAAAAAVLVAGLGLLRPEPYGSHDPSVRWLERNLPGGAAVALGGIWDPGGLSPVLPAHGPRLENRVDYLGRFVVGTMRAWERAEPFQRQLRTGGYDVVILGSDSPSRPGGEEPEATWARELGYEPVARSPHLVVLARAGRTVVAQSSRRSPLPEQDGAVPPRAGGLRRARPPALAAQ